MQPARASIASTRSRPRGFASHWRGALWSRRLARGRLRGAGDPARRRSLPGRGALLCGLLAALCASALSAAASASPFEDSTLGGAVFTGPVHPHATALFTNPAALGLTGRGTHVYFGGSMRLDQYTIDRQVLRDPEAGLEPGARVKDTTAAPGTSLALYGVGENIAVGVAVSMVVLDQFIEEREELGFHTLGGRQRQYVWRDFAFIRRAWSYRAPLPMPTLAGSYRWRNFYFGVGVSLRFTTLDYSFYRDTALERGQEGIDGQCGDEPCGIGNPQAAERYDLRVSTESLFSARNLVLTGGAMWEFLPAWWLGVTYQSPPGFLSSLSLQGEARITPAPRENRDPFSARAEFIYRLPQTLSVGVRGSVAPELDVFAAVRWQNLSRQQLFDIRLIDPTIGGGGRIPEWFSRYRGLDDSFTISAGVEQREGGWLRLGARVAVDTGATDERTVTPLQVEGTSLGAAVGAELRVLDRPRLVLYASYGLTYYPSLTVTEDSAFDPRAQIDCVDEDYALDACEAVIVGRALPTPAGTYERLSHGFRAALRYDFL
ncbi:hypothetical protein [Haliangium ochraceum]|nr:hypothetical protein [Haliangium ochraceum]